MSNNQYDEWKERFEEAQSLMIAGSHDAACSLFLDALCIAETGCVSAAEMADTLEGLAASKRWTDEAADVSDWLDRAEIAREHALEETIAEYGDSHLETAEAYYRFAFHNVIRRRPAIVISYFEKVLAIKIIAFGKYHFEVANTLMIMGGSHPEESEKTKLWERAVEILEHLLDNPDECDSDSANYVARALRGCLENLATQAFGQHRVDDAEKYFRRALASCAVTASKPSCTLCNTATFGKVLLSLKKYDECEVFLTKAIANGSSFMKRHCSEVLADLYDETGRSNEAKTLRNTL